MWRESQQKGTDITDLTKTDKKVQNETKVMATLYYSIAMYQKAAMHIKLRKCQNMEGKKRGS